MKHLEDIINRPFRKKQKRRVRNPHPECPRCAADLDDRGRCLAQCSDEDQR